MTDLNIPAIVTVAKEAATASQSIRETKDGRQFILLPNGAIQWLTNRTELPEFITGSRVFHEGDSLAEYVKRFKTSDTQMTADIDSNSVRVNLDYHGPGAAARNAHLASWPVPFSEEYKVWSRWNAQWLEQDDFLEHLEENLAEITDPAPTKILELISDFSMVKTTEFRSAKDRSNGNKTLQWIENGAVKGEIKMPKMFALSMPIYRGEQPVQFSAFLRTKVDEGSLELQYEFHRIEPVKQAAFRLAVTRVAEQCGLTPLYGK